MAGLAVPPALPGRAIKGVYRGYMPIGLPQHQPPNRIKHWSKFKGKPVYTLYPKKEIEGYSEDPEYPSIQVKGAKAQIRLDWYDKLKKVPTLDGKMYEIIRHGNHYIGNTRTYINHYNSLPMAQYLTHTRVIDKLPLSDDETCKPELLDEIKNIVLDQIAVDKYQSRKDLPHFVSKSYTRQEDDTRLDNLVVQNIYSSVKRKLAIETNPQLLDYQNDLDPAIRSWWFHSGFEPPNKKVFYKCRKDDRGRINQMIQTEGEAAINLRSSSFLVPPVSFEDPLVTETDAIEECCYPLKHYGFKFTFTYPVTLPGEWYSECRDFDFPHTTFLTTQCLKLRHLKPYKNVKPLNENENCLLSQAILTGFSWTNSLAMYHGFTPFQEVEYPFTSNVITTDGKNWLFNVYQLNSHSFHRDLDGPKRNNLCWSSGLMQLYKDFDGSKFHEVNDNVIKLLVKMLSQQTSREYTDSLNLKPYLGEDGRTETEIKLQQNNVLRAIENRKDKYRSHDWNVPLWENIFFNWKPARHGIREVKARYHSPKPKFPKIFE